MEGEVEGAESVVKRERDRGLSRTAAFIDIN